MKHHCPKSTVHRLRFHYYEGDIHLQTEVKTVIWEGINQEKKEVWIGVWHFILWCRWWLKESAFLYIHMCVCLYKKKLFSWVFKMCTLLYLSFTLITILFETMKRKKSSDFSYLQIIVFKFQTWIHCICIISTTPILPVIPSPLLPTTKLFEIHIFFYNFIYRHTHTIYWVQLVLPVCTWS